MNLEQRVTNLERVLGKGNFITSTVQNLAAKFNGRFALANRTALPATCAVGELAVLNGVQYVCSAANTWSTVGGSVGGSNTQIQFNDGGVLGGDADFAWNKTDKRVIIGGGGNDVDVYGASSAVGFGVRLGNSPDGGGNGGAVSLYAGFGSSSGGNGGGVTILAGETYDGNSAGGDIDIEAGYVSANTGTGNGGNVTISAGGAVATGASPSLDSYGGSVSIVGGNSLGAGNAGGVSIRAGSGGGTGAGGSISIGGGNAGVSGTDGGDVTIFGGAETSGNRGNVNINTGALATTTNGGFLVVPKCAGAPTGTPVANAALIYDTTNNKLYVYNGAWKSVTLT